MNKLLLSKIFFKYLILLLFFKIGSLHLAQGNHFFNGRTVLNQFNYVRTTVKSSNVMPYGDFSVGQDKLSAYIGKVPRLFSTNNIQSTIKNNVSISFIILT